MKIHCNWIAYALMFEFNSLVKLIAFTFTFIMNQNYRLKKWSKIHYEVFLYCSVFLLYLYKNILFSFSHLDIFYCQTVAIDKWLNLKKHFIQPVSRTFFIISRLHHYTPYNDFSSFLLCFTVNMFFLIISVWINL